jgi:hypothetical protein
MRPTGPLPPPRNASRAITTTFRQTNPVDDLDITESYQTPPSHDYGSISVDDANDQRLHSYNDWQPRQSLQLSSIPLDQGSISNAVLNTEQRRDSDTRPSAQASQGMTSSESQSDIDLLSEKLGTINVLGMGRTASQDRAAISAAASRDKILSTKADNQGISTGMPTDDLTAGSFTITPNPSRIALSSVSALNGDQASPLKHKDSFGHNGNLERAVEGGTSSLASFQLPEEIMEDKEAEEVRSDVESVPNPAAFEILFGTGDGSPNRSGSSSQHFTPQKVSTFDSSLRSVCHLT